jgi:tetratricopeptide (TPR) repeat protein
LDEQAQTWLGNAPHSSAVRRELGNIYLRLYRASGRREDLLEAIRYYEAAVQRYPHSNLLHAHLAWVHHLAGNTDDARQSAARALELDERTPHQDQKLSSPLQRIADPQPEVWQSSPAQRMTQILTN